MKSEIKKKQQAAQSVQAKTKAPVQPKAKAVVIPDKKDENKFILITLAAYIVIGLIGVFHHEMWRDEMQTWLVGATSSGFGEFMHNMKNEFDPFLWFFINFVLSRFSDSPDIERVVHLLISAASVYLILKYAPFSRLQKVLLSFSYYVFFEYGLVSRGYALTVFFVFLFCALYNNQSKYRYLILAAILFCLPNATAVHGLVFTIALTCMMVTDYYFSQDASIRKKYKPLHLLIGVLIVMIGIYCAIKSVAPPSGTDRSNTWFTGFNSQRLTFALRTFWMSFIPIPNMSTINSWNSNIFFQSDTGAFTFNILLLLSIALFLFCSMLYSKKLSIAVFYVAATLGVLILCYSNGVVFALLAARHYGFIFITFVAAAWLAPRVKNSKLTVPILGSLGEKLKLENKFTYVLTGVFAINMLGGVIAYSKDYVHVFSNVKATGQYIASHNLARLPEAGFIDYAVSPIAAYTHQAIYFPDRDTIGKFTTMGDARFSFDLKILFPRLANYISKQKDSVVYISTGDYFGIGDGKVIDNISFTKIASFDGAIVPDENYIVYIARKFDINKMMQDSASYKNPATVSSIVSVANDLIGNNKLDEAGKILSTVQEKTQGKPVPYLHDYFGKLYVKENKQADAEKEFNTEIALNLQKEDAFFNLGMLYFQNKDYDRAIISWDSTVSLNPKNADAFNNLGVCYLNFKKDNNKGITYFEKAVELSPNYTQGYLNILVCAQNMNDQDTMVKYIRILLDKGTTVDDIKAKGINITDALLQKVNSR